MAQKEPLIQGKAGLFSPSTGILDTHSLMKNLESHFKARGGISLYNSTVKNIKKLKHGFKVTLHEAKARSTEVSTNYLINAAGLGAAKISTQLGIPKNYHFSKGEYFTIKGLPAHSMKHLIYPPPEKTSLGIHTVINLAGRCRLGPNAFYINNDPQNYQVEVDHKLDFYKSAKQYLPFLKEEDLAPDTAGIRPKLQGPDMDFADFYISEESKKGLPGFINLVGIESPGLTSCLAIAEYVESIL